MPLTVTRSFDWLLTSYSNAGVDTHISLIGKPIVLYYMDINSPRGARQGAKEDVEVVHGTPSEEYSSEEYSSEECSSDESLHIGQPAQDQLVPPNEKQENEIRLLEVLHMRASELLGLAGRRRVTDDIKRRYLTFLEMELSDIVGLLNSSDSPLQDHDAQVMLWQWKHFDELIRFANSFLEIAKRRGRPSVIFAGEYHRMCRRELLGCCSKMALSCSLLENVGRYSYPLPFRSDVKQPAQVAKVGGVPLFGIDKPINKLFGWLALREVNKNLSVMCIVGSLGIGKTALAMELHNRLNCHASGGCYYFQFIIMAQMSPGSERNEILLQDILSKVSDPATPALPSDHSRPTAMDLLVADVLEWLQNKRYFICIDGMQEASDWEKIKGAFPNDNIGSRIMITTRDGSIARSQCSCMHAHQMKPLNQLDSERLLLTRIFGSLPDGGHPGMRSSSYDGFLNACGGIPLFINAIADYFKQQFWTDMFHVEEDWEERDWFVVLSQMGNFTYTRQAPNPVRQSRKALTSTFDDLLYQFFSEMTIPYQPMTLLLYMSLFPHGYKFDKDRLITKWIHEGLAHDPKEAEMYFSQLICRNIITSTSVNCITSPDEAETWQLLMNRFMQEFLASRSAEVGFGFTYDALNLAAASTPRRLVLHHSDPVVPSLLQKLDLSQTRSLAISGAVDGIPLDEFVNLLVLDLEGWENLTDDVLRQVCTSKMSLLQHLSVRNTQVRKLPHEIKNLCSLMVLDLSYTQISELPLEIFELELLEVMFLCGTQIKQLPKQIVGLKDTLHSIILGGEGMVNLNGTSIRVPQDIQHLRCLVTLVTIDLSQQPTSFVKALGSLRELQFLGITWSFHQSTNKSYHEALLTSIKEWRNLKSLTIHCGLGCSMEFLGSLSDPPKNLEKFKVTMGRFACVPKWIEKLKFLSFLQITICKKGTDLKIIGDLRKLQCLILGLDFIPEEAIAIGNEGFGKLHRFSVDCPMPWLSFSTGAMKNLRYLQLKFRSIPAKQINVPWGIENLGSLMEVVLCYHKRDAKSPSVKKTVEAVKEQVANHPNLIDLFINGTEHDVQAAEEETEWNSVATQSGIHAEVKHVVPAVDEKLKMKSTCEIEEVGSDA